MSNTRLTVLAIGVAALMTFFMPVVHLSPPAMGQADWSPYDVTVYGLRGTRSNAVMWLVYGSGDYWNAYAALGVALLLLWIRHWHFALLFVCALNISCMVFRPWYFSEIDFLGPTMHWPGQLNGGTFSRDFAWYGFLALQGLMAYVTWVDYRYVKRQRAF